MCWNFSTCIEVLHKYSDSYMETKQMPLVNIRQRYCNAIFLFVFVNFIPF